MCRWSQLRALVFVGAVSLAVFLLGHSSSRAADAPILGILKDDERDRVAQLIEGARRDGAVHVLNVLFSDHTAELLRRTFRELYGLGDNFKLTNIRKGSGSLVDMAEQEMRTGALTFDIVIANTPPFYIEAAQAGYFTEYTSPYWREFGFDEMVREQGQLADPPRFVTPFAYVFRPVWNRKCPGFNHVEITSYRDLLDPKFQHNTIVSDVPKSFTYSSLWLTLQKRKPFVQYMGQELDFIAYMKKYNEVTAPMVLFRTEDKMEKIISCIRALDMWNLAGRVYQYKLKDPTLDLAVGSYQEGMVMHGNYMAIPKGAPHPDAAKLFYDFLLRPQGQTELVRGEIVYSFMKEFKPPPEVGPLIIPIKGLSVQWKNITNDLLKEVHQTWKDIFLK